MSEYISVTTSVEVFRAIRKAHPELRVFGSATYPEDGNVFTSWGFPGAYAPILAACTTWDAYGAEPGERPNEQTVYWLCSAIEG